MLNSKNFYKNQNNPVCKIWLKSFLIYNTVYSDFNSWYQYLTCQKQTQQCNDIRKVT